MEENIKEYGYAVTEYDYGTGQNYVRQNVLFITTELLELYNISDNLKALLVKIPNRKIEKVNIQQSEKTQYCNNFKVDFNNSTTIYFHTTEAITEYIQLNNKQSMLIYHNKIGTWYTLKTFNQDCDVNVIVNTIHKLENNKIKDKLTCMICHEDIDQIIFYHPYYKCICNNILVTCKKCLQEPFDCPYCRKLTNTPIEPSKHILTEQGKIEESIDVTEENQEAISKMVNFNSEQMEYWKSNPKVIEMLKKMKKINLFMPEIQKTEDNPQITKLEKQIQQLRKTIKKLKQSKGKKKNERIIE